MDVVEFGADAYAYRKQVGVKQLYNQVPQTAWSQLELEAEFESVRVVVAVGVRVAVPVGDRMPAE